MLFLKWDDGFTVGVFLILTNLFTDLEKAWIETKMPF
jgi:hypothetical protein